MAVLCEQCAALCCRYFGLPIDNPKTVKDYDNIRWYLMHENVVVFVEKKQWYLGVMTRCKNLLPNNLCGIYKERPRICREFTTDNCDFHGAQYDYEHLFTSSEQLREFAEAKLGKSLISKPREQKVAKKIKKRGASKRVELRVVK